MLLEWIKKHTHVIQALGVCMAVALLLVALHPLVPDPPLKADFVRHTAVGLHNGRHRGGNSTFLIQVRFSDGIKTSYQLLCRSVSIKGGRCTAARRVNAAKHDLWQLTINPSTKDESVEMGFNLEQDCQNDAAICTKDHRPLTRADSVCVPPMTSLAGCPPLTRTPNPP